jgi:hypothetical protein
MRFEERIKLVKKLQEIEEKFPVDEWKLAGVHFWPLLKIKQFLDEFDRQNHVKRANKSRPRNIFYRKVRKLYARIRAYYLVRTFKLRPARFIFSGAPSHRVSWQEHRFNRYFDPMIDYLEEMKVASYLFEYKRLNEGPIYRQERVYDLTLLTPYFKRQVNIEHDWNQLKQDKSFIEFLEFLCQNFGGNEQQVKSTLKNSLAGVLTWKDTFAFLFKRIKPDYALGLCYYSTAMFGMNLAAHEQGVVSIDMQHGTEGNLHPAYLYSRLPKEGFNVLPRQFWAWDEGTLSGLRQWLPKGQYHSAVLSGNPWISLFQNSKPGDVILKSNLPLILYTLQPIQPVIDDYMLAVIKATRNNYQWWLRLHPRQGKQDQDQLDRLISEQGLSNVVEIEQATKVPLPILLNRASLHISKYSGAISEAALMGTPSLILEKIGMEAFADLIMQEKAISIEFPDIEGVKEAIVRLMDAKKKTTNISSIHYKDRLNECIV